MKKLVVFTLLSLMVATGCNRDRHSRRDPDQLASYLSSKLELNDSQKASLKLLAGKLKDSQNKLEAQKSGAKSEFSALLSSEKFDDAKAKAIFNNLEKTLTTEIDPLLRDFSTFHATLSAKQRKELSELLESHWKE